MEILDIRGSYLVKNFSLVEDGWHLFLMLLVITSSRYQSFNKVFFIKLSLSASFGLEDIIKAQRTFFIKLILGLEGQNEICHLYDRVNIGLL